MRLIISVLARGRRVRRRLTWRIGFSRLTRRLDRVIRGLGRLAGWFGGLNRLVGGITRRRLRGLGGWFWFAGRFGLAGSCWRGARRWRRGARRWRRGAGSCGWGGTTSCCGRRSSGLRGAGLLGRGGGARRDRSLCRSRPGCRCSGRCRDGWGGWRRTGGQGQRSNRVQSFFTANAVIVPVQMRAIAWCPADDRRRSIGIGLSTVLVGTALSSTGRALNDRPVLELSRVWCAPPWLGRWQPCR